MGENLKFWIVKILDSENSIQAKGTGFWVAKNGYVLTSTHVIKDLGYPWIEYKNKKAPAETIAQQGDVSLLRVYGLTGESPPLGEHWQRGDIIDSIGYQYEGFQERVGYFPIEGIISGVSELDGVERITLKGAIHVKPGTSGAPAFNRNTGKVIGVISDKWEPQQVAFVLPLDSLLKKWDILKAFLDETDHSPKDKQQQLLQRRLEGLKQRKGLLIRKVILLEEELTVETRSIKGIQLDSSIKEINLECQQIEEQLQDLESRLCSQSWKTETVQEGAVEEIEEIRKDDSLRKKNRKTGSKVQNDLYPKFTRLFENADLSKPHIWILVVTILVVGMAMFVTYIVINMIDQQTDYFPYEYSAKATPFLPSVIFSTPVDTISSQTNISINELTPKGPVIAGNTVSTSQLYDILRTVDGINRLDKLREYEPYLGEISINDIINLLRLFDYYKIEAFGMLLDHIPRELTRQETNKMLSAFSFLEQSDAETKIRLHAMSFYEGGNQTSIEQNKSQNYTVSGRELYDILRSLDSSLRFDKIVEYDPFLEEISVNDLMRILSLLTLFKTDAVTILIEHIPRPLTPQEKSIILNPFGPITQPEVETIIRQHTMSFSE